MRVPMILILLGAMAAVGCEEDGGDVSLDDDSAGDDDSVGDDDDSALPDYSTSPCWGDAETTRLLIGADFVDVATTCRAEGERTLLYVQDELWEDVVDQALVNGFMHGFELLGPSGAHDPSTGVLGNDEAMFGALDTGALPGGKLSVFVVDTEGRDDAYVCPTDHDWCDAPSIHLDGPTLSPLDGETALGLAARETCRMIHQDLDEDEDLWLDEALAQAATTINGYYVEENWVQAFLANPDADWGPGGADHDAAHVGALLLWGSYLAQVGGPTLMRAITAEPTDGWASIDAAIQTAGLSTTADALLVDWIVAVYLDQPDLGYGFDALDLGTPSVVGTVGAGDQISGSLAPYGVDYLRVEDEATLTVAATTLSGGPITAVGVVMGTAVDVVDLSAGGVLEVPASTTAFIALTAPVTTQYELSFD